MEKVKRMHPKLPFDKWHEDHLRMQFALVFNRSHKDCSVMQALDFSREFNKEGLIGYLEENKDIMEPIQEYGN